MATIKLILSKTQNQKKNKKLESNIFIRYSHQKRTVLFTTHKIIRDEFWDKKNQKVKRAFSGHNFLNIYLHKTKGELEDIVNELLINGENPDVHTVKSAFNDRKEQKHKAKTYTFHEFAEYFLQSCKRHKSEGTVKTYRTTLNQVLKYEKYTRKRIDWKDIDLDFYYDFQEFYTGVQGYLNNGFGRVIKVLKVILNEATEKGYNTHLFYKNKKFKTVREEVNNIYLSDTELQKIMDLNLSHSKTLERVRDLFVVGCYTGLRFSDFSQIKPEHIVGDTIKVRTIKTDTMVTIPLLEPVKKIMAKYKDNANSLPKSCVNQTMNKHLKEIGRLAKLDDSILKVRTKGRERVENVHKKFELISTHTARRSFATNMFKRGVPSRVIMKITGHSSERAFSSYIKISQDENAEIMLNYLNQTA